MDQQGPAAMLFNLVKEQLEGTEDLQQIEAQVTLVADTCKLSQDVVTEVLTEFASQFAPAVNVIRAPRLLVDWGELPRVGYQVRPEFSLLCPAYSARPEIHIKVDRDLDHDAYDPLRRPQIDEPGLWAFHVPFRMTSEGMDCRPGHYLLDVEVTFREAPAGAARFYRCRIRLNVPDLNDDQGGVLEIDGDGQSMVNLQGYNLKQFSKVVLKGGEDSVINLQNAMGGNNGEDENDEPLPDNKPATTFEYQLKVNSEKQSRLPTVAATTERRAYLDSAGLVFEDGRRTLIYSRPRLTFGRSRDNDVVLRFLPRSKENDNNSRNLSRTHCVAEVVPEGIEIRDESRTGIELNYSVVREREVVTTHHTGEVTPIQLGVTGAVPTPLTLEMITFGPDRYAEKDDLEFWHELYSEMVGARSISRLARESLSLQLDAVRYDRVENLKDEESYVLLLREALIGGSPNQAAIVLSDHSSPVQARLLHLDRTFWIEPLNESKLPSINGTPLQVRSLTPLSPGMEIQFGDEVATFDRPTQLYLD